ncbi:MAG: cell division protein FtsZ [Hyphomicrobiaceae bacterium]
MSINIQLPKLTDLTPRLTVVGVGGAGCNGINNMIAAGLTGVEFVAANTDAQALAASSAEHRLQLGAQLTEGLGAGAKPEIGQAAAEEAIDDIKSQIAGSHMLFVAAGMGGGTGTGAASVIARAARELGILTVGVVTRPFQFEGSRRMRIADAGINELRDNVDTLIVIPNQNLFRIANENTTFAEAFVLADQVLYSGVACIVDLIIKEGLINLDFADVRAVMSGMGSAMMGTGEASGDRRAILAAEEAIANPLLDDVSLQGANGVLLSITGAPDMTLYEVDEAASRVRQEVDPEANIIVGATYDDSLEDRIRVSIVASGMNNARAQGAQPVVNNSAASGAFPAPPPLLNPTTGGEQDASQSGQTEELQQRLSNAMNRQPSPPAPAPQTTWQGPNDVVIQETGATPRQTVPAVATAGGHSSSARPASASGSNQTFQPQQPSEMPRSGARMPEIEQFPAVGQREYQARVTQGKQGEPTQNSPTQSPAAARSVGKPGLFQRLAGIGRRGNESNSPSSSPSNDANGPALREQQARAQAYAEAHGIPEDKIDGAPANAKLPKVFKKQQ